MFNFLDMTTTNKYKQIYTLQLETKQQTTHRTCGIQSSTTLPERVRHLTTSSQFKYRQVKNYHFSQFYD